MQSRLCAKCLEELTGSEEPWVRRLKRDCKALEGSGPRVVVGRVLGIRVGVDGGGASGEKIGSVRGRKEGLLRGILIPHAMTPSKRGSAD